MSGQRADNLSAITVRIAQILIFLWIMRADNASGGQLYRTHETGTDTYGRIYPTFQTLNAVLHEADNLSGQIEFPSPARGL